jgi:hypothetical protein
VPRGLAAQNLYQFFELEPHLVDDLLALIDVHLRIVAGEAVPCAANGESLFLPASRWVRTRAARRSCGRVCCPVGSRPAVAIERLSLTARSHPPSYA